MMLFRTTPYYLLTHPGFRKNPSLFIFRALLWRLKCALGMSTTVSLPTLRAKLYLPATRNGEGTTMLYAAREHFEPELLPQHNRTSESSLSRCRRQHRNIYLGVGTAFQPGILL